MLREDEATPENMEKKLAKAGVTFQSNRERHKAIVEAVFSYLLERAEIKEVPHAWGWNSMSSGKWHFENDHRKTFGGICDGC